MSDEVKKNRGYAVKLNYDTASLFLFSSLRMTVSSTIRRDVLLHLRRNRSFRNC